MVSTGGLATRRGKVSKFATIGVAGAGAWGLALANAAAAAGRAVVVWGRDADALAALARTRTSAHLPGVALAPAATVASEIGALAAADALLLVVPAQAARAAAARLAERLAPRPLIVCAKGIERGSLRFMTEVVAEAAPGWPAAILSGPSFAADVAAGLPTAVTLASVDEALARALSAALSGPNLRLYHSTDPRGVEIGGAAKNVLAIACGMAAGRELGASARAALIARGFAELARLGAAWGARQETLMGLSGLGDLVLTCGSAQSRNFALGEALGRGESPREASHGKLAEGAYTAAALVEIARERHVEMPIAEAVDAILAGRMSVQAAIDALLMRPLRAEA
jgi:glycerol-3-phosphate dehydrogenase (NAD(P)+)